MAPTLHCVRHAQGYHNLSTANHVMRDPDLTEKGIQQCTTLSQEFPSMDQIDLIVASPIRRTLYTALYSFAPIISSKNIPVIALPELQETSDLPCDTGSDPDILQREFAAHPAVDLGLVKDGWNIKSGSAMASPDAGSIIARARKAKAWLRARPEKNIAVVTHGGYLHYFTDDWDGIAHFTAGTGWANTEFREYTFRNENADDPEQQIVETSVSRERRRGFEKPLGEAEQRNLRKSVVAEWTRLGYIKVPAGDVGEAQRKIFEEVLGDQRALL